MTIHINVPNWNSEKSKKLVDYFKRGLPEKQIAKLLDVHVGHIGTKLDDMGIFEHDQTAWDGDAFAQLIQLIETELNVAEIAKLMDKTEGQVVHAIKYVRNSKAHKSSGSRGWAFPKFSAKGETHLQLLYTTIVKEELPSKITKKRVVGTKPRAKKSRYNESRYNKQTNRYVLDEWWQFGIIEKSTETEDKLVLHSADANKVTLIKKYTPNWADVKLKAKGLQGEFVAVRMVQNYEQYEPRLIDITASQGIMSLAKSFPGDTRKQSFAGRYKWQHFGVFEAKKIYDEEVDQSVLFLINADGDTVIFPLSNNEGAIEIKVLNAIDTYENQPILICIDVKNSVGAGGYTQIVDIHPAYADYELYAGEHNVIVETIARTRDASIEKQGELNYEADEYRRVIAEMQKEHEQKVEELQKQVDDREKALFLFKRETDAELRDYEEQERFLREAKDALHDYKVQLLAAERDKQGDEPVAIEMKGMTIVNPTPSDDEIHKLLDQMARAVKKKAVDLPEQPVEKAPEENKSPFSGVTAAMFDDRDGEIMPFLKQLEAKVDKMLLHTQMTEADKNWLDEYMKEEELEEGQDRAEHNQEVMDILDRKEELFTAPVKIKVRGGHSRNILTVRFGVDLTQQKAKDRLTVEFIKHMRSNQFLCRLPDYYNQECILAVCIDSEDAKDVALKTSLFYHSAKELQKAFDEVVQLGGKRLVGGKPAKYMRQHREIYSLAGVPLPSEAAS